MFQNGLDRKDVIFVIVPLSAPILKRLALDNCCDGRLLQVSEVKPVQFLDSVPCGHADEDKQGMCNSRIN